MWKLAFNTLPLFSVIVGLATSLGAYMTYSSVRTSYLGVIHSRLSIEADQIGSAIETALSLGIALTGQGTLTRVLAERAGTDPLVLSIDVRSPAGEVLFSSRPTRIGAPAAAAAPDREAFHLARPVLTDIGDEAGSVLIRYRREPIEQHLAALAGEIIEVAVPLALLSVAGASLAVFLILRNLRDRVRRTVQRLADPVRNGTAAGSLSP